MADFDPLRTSATWRQFSTIADITTHYASLTRAIFAKGTPWEWGKMRHVQTTAILLLLAGCAAGRALPLTTAQNDKCRYQFDPINPDGFLYSAHIFSDCLKYGRLERMRTTVYWRVDPDGNEALLYQKGWNIVPLRAGDKATDWADIDDETVLSPKPAAGCTKAIELEFLGRRAIGHVPDFKLRHSYIKIERVLRVGHVRHFPNAHPPAACGEGLD